MLNELRGVQVVDGELVIVTVETSLEGERTVTMPVEDAYAIGCILIELRQLAKEREQELRETGELLDVRAMREEFATRLRQRQAFNA